MTYGNKFILFFACFMHDLNDLMYSLSNTPLRTVLSHEKNCPKSPQRVESDLHDLGNLSLAHDLGTHPRVGKSKNTDIYFPDAVTV